MNPEKPTFMTPNPSPSAATEFSSVVYNYELFDPFHKSLEGRPMKALDGIDHIQLQLRTIIGPDPGQRIRNFRQFLTQVSEIRVEVMLNSVPIQTHRFTKADIVVPEESAIVVKNGTILYDLHQNEPEAYKDIEGLYGRAISSAVQ